MNSWPPAADSACSQWSMTTRECLVAVPDTSLSGRRVVQELLNETLFLGLAHARVEIAAWVDDYKRERPHSSPRYATLAAYL